MLSRAIPLACLIWCLITFGNAQVADYTTPFADVPIFRPSPNIGDGVFSNLPFQVGGFTSIGSHDNIFLQHWNRRGSGITEASLDFSSHIANERTVFDADLSAGIDYYWNRPGGNVDPNIRLGLSYFHQINPRAYLAVSDYLVYTAQPNYQFGIGAANSVLDYLYSSTTVSLGY